MPETSTAPITAADPNPGLPAGPLAARTMADLRAYFASRGHHPSAEHWAALEDVVRTLDAMAAGTCDRTVFLAALDPGVGKSSAVLAFARSLLASPDHHEVGMIVCVGRIAEAKSMAEALRDFAPGVGGRSGAHHDTAADRACHRREGL
jgi:hypothetical protein